MYNKYFKHEKGITGLETAIILIAFVVVAAVFAYTALSAGLFATQKSQEAVYSGLTEARSTVELKGAVIATANTTGAGTTGTVDTVTFTVSNVLGGEPIDFTAPTGSTGAGIATGNDHKVVINYLDADQEVDNLYWTLTKVGDADSDSLLEAGEKFQITVGASGNGLVDALNPNLTTNCKFSLAVLTPVGAVLTIQRTTPAYIDNIVNLR
jgi:archaeal flagellin FlaB